MDKNTKNPEANIEDDQLSEMRKKYAFDPHFLKKNFYFNVKQHISESRLKLKLYQLFSFRLKYAGYIPIQKLLFFFPEVTLKNSVRFQIYFEDVNNFKPDFKNGFTISNFLNNDFFNNIPYIRDYFCYSTFPSIFGNFITEEYFEKGYQFIKNNFNDTGIVPFLVSSFLGHSMLFQDRLISTFISNVVAYIIKKNAQNTKNDSKNEEEDSDEKNDDVIFDNKGTSWPFKDISPQKSVQLFMKSFEDCLSYFSQYQLQIVQDLYEKDPKLAIFCISELFIKDVLQSLSKYHSLSDYTNVLTEDCSLLDPPNTAYIIRHNILNKIYNYLDFEQIIKLMCDSPVYFEFPKIRELIFNNGCDLIFSISDFKIIELFGVYIGSKGANIRDVISSPTQKNVNYASTNDKIEQFELIQFTNETFSISNAFQEYFSSNAVPDPKSRTHNELKVCQETQEVHSFLLNHSGHLNKLQICTEATKEVVNSKIREFIGEILMKQQVFEPTKYELSQISQYSSAMFKAIMSRLPPQLIEKIDFDSIEPFIKKTVESLSDKCLYRTDNFNVVDLSCKMVEEILNEINSQIGEKKLHLTNDDFSRDRFYVFLQFLGEVSFRFRIAIFNKENFKFCTKDFVLKNFNFQPQLKDAEAKNFKSINNSVQNLVIKNSLKIDANGIKSYDESEGNDEFEEGNFDEIQTIIYLSNKAMENDSYNMRSDFNIGNRIQTFVTIQKLIQVATNKSEFLSKPENKKFVFYKIFGYDQSDLGNEGIYISNSSKRNSNLSDDSRERACFFFRANLIKARYFLTQVLEKGKGNLLMQTELRMAHKRLNSLADFFGMSSSISV